MLEKIIDFELKYKLIGESIHKYKWDILGDFQTV